MRKILLSVVLVITTSFAFGANYYAIASGNWSAPSTWSLTDGGAAATTIPTSADDVIMDGTINVTIDNAFAVCRSVTLNNTKKNEGVSGLSTITFSPGSKLVVSGSINMNGNGRRLGGIIMSDGGHLVCGVLNVTGNNPGVWTPGSGTVEITAAGTLPLVTSAGTNTLFGTFNNLIINGGIVSLGQATTINGSLTISTASSQLDATTNSFPINIVGNWTNNGQFVPRAGLVTFNGTGTQGISSSNFNNITFNNNGIKTATGVLAIAGNVTINNNFTAGAFTHTVGGNWTNNGTFDANSSTIEFNGTAAQSIGASTFNNVIFNNGGVKTATGALSIAGNVVINSNFTAGAFTHTVRGNWTKNGSFEASGSTIRFSATTGNQEIGPSNFNHVSFDNEGFKTAVGNLAITGDVTINSNFNAGSGNFYHAVGGNWTNSGSAITPFTPGNSTIAFNGTADQLISSANAKTTSFNNFVINKSSGRVRLAAPVTINRQVSFSGGIIDGTSNTVPLLFLENAVIDPAAGPSNLSHVNGPVRKSVSSVNAAASGFIFPVGKNGKYVPIAVSNATGLGTIIEGEYIPVSAYSLGRLNSPGLKQISQCEYWSLKRVNTSSGNPTMNVTLGWGPDNACTGLSYVAEPSSIVIAAFEPASSTWNRHGGTVQSGATAVTGKVTWSGVTDVYAFTLGTTSLANSLPVVFANFTATQREEGVQLSFSNLTEEDVAIYHVERSANGSDFQSIGTITPLVNANSRADYSFLDKLPLGGASYYRIRALENTGKTVYSDVVMLRTNAKQYSFVLYPNPARLNTTLSLQMGNLPAGRYQVRLFSQVGQLLHTTQFVHRGGFVSTTVPTKGLSAGSYIVELNGNQRMVRHLVIQ